MTTKSGDLRLMKVENVDYFLEELEKIQLQMGKAENEFLMVTFDYNIQK